MKKDIKIKIRAAVKSMKTKEVLLISDMMDRLYIFDGKNLFRLKQLTSPKPEN